MYASKLGVAILFGMGLAGTGAIIIGVEVVFFSHWRRAYLGLRVLY